MGYESTIDGLDGEPLLLHPSVLPDAPDPLEPQLLFLRGAAFLQHAVYLIESAILKLEEIRKVLSIDGTELRLCYIENGKYGGVEIGNPDGPLGKKAGPKVKAYREVLGEKGFKEQITGLLKKSIRDLEKFQSHFDSLESPNAIPTGDIAYQTEFAFLLSESIRPGNHNNLAPPLPNAPAMFTTYHPLLVESHFSVLICQLMLADFCSILPTFARTAAMVDGLEGYPIFLPPRSMGQAEFIEVLERLAGGWKHGTQPHSLSALRGKARLSIVAPPSSPPVPYSVSPTETMSLPDDDTSCARSYAPSSSASTSTSRKNSDSQQGDCSFVPHAHDITSKFHASPPPSPSPRADGVQALDCARILLAPVVKRQRQREKAEKAAGTSGKKKSATINIPLHGPRVEIILAWLGAVHLPELDLF
jgi:hypothetical protein